MSQNELYHFGVKGMKWGVRKKRYLPTSGVKGGLYAKPKKPVGAADGDGLSAKPKKPLGARSTSVNKDYTAKQRKQDRAFYGKGGEKRINKKLNEGHGLRGARHYEAERKERNEKIQRTAKKVTKKTAKVAVKVGKAYMTDQILFGGTGTRMVKEAVKQTGRAVVTAWVLANGGSDVRWYDN